MNIKSYKGDGKTDKNEAPVEWDAKTQDNMLYIFDDEGGNQSMSYIRKSQIFTGSGYDLWLNEINTLNLYIERYKIQLKQ